MVFAIHWHESALDLHVFPIPIPPPTSLSTRSLWVFPVHQVWALVSCIQPGLAICFTLDNIHVSMLFSWNIPPSPSLTESKSLFYTSVSLRLTFKSVNFEKSRLSSIKQLSLIRLIRGLNRKQHEVPDKREFCLQTIFRFKLQHQFLPGCLAY